MAADLHPLIRSNFRRFFLRGLGILLPSVLTLWILVAVYNFVDQKIAAPINRGVQELVLWSTPWPYADDLTDSELQQLESELNSQQRKDLKAASDRTAWLEYYARREELRQWWNRSSIGGWAVLDLIGLLIAVVLIYGVGLMVGSYIGHYTFRRGEELLRRVPVFRQVYPYVKQVTDFLVGDTTGKIQFNRVVAVQYPRKGLWSVGLVTGETMPRIESKADRKCITVFIPSSPTPFTGYVITVPVEDTIELNISIDQALRFTVSGGVILPGADQQQEQQQVEAQASGAADGTTAQGQAGPQPAAGGANHDDRSA